MDAPQSAPPWAAVDPARAATLSDARRPLPHAAQFVACLGISYLPKAGDDSHTSMEWVRRALAGHRVGPRAFRLAVRPHPFSLVALDGNAERAVLPLHGLTIADGTAWVREQAQAMGLDGARYSLATHYAIPDHAVDRGAPFDAADADAFAQLALWYGNAHRALQRVAADGAGSPVRCWPHHFDIATLLPVGEGITIGVGMEPGDDYYDEPYWYVNLSPAPATAPAAALAGGGSWHSREWIGAVLPGSRLDTGAAAQEAQVARFIASATSALAPA